MLGIIECDVEGCESALVKVVPRNGTPGAIDDEILAYAFAEGWIVSDDEDRCPRH